MEGVQIHAEGQEVEKFLKELKENPPPNAVISEIKVNPIPPKGFKTFSIQKSKENGVPEVHITPDLAICDECIKEMFSPENRRYMYPFINCTHCGPRYTIIKEIPYDRKNTTMVEFKMCSECEKEYKNPKDRRFHAQPIACPKCGPQVFLYTGKGEKINTKEPLKYTVQALKKGKIVAIKGLGGFHIACSALSKKAVLKLRRKKKRPRKPFALMAKDLKTIKKYCIVTQEEQKLLVSPKSPIVLLEKRDNSLYYIAPKNKYLGVMLPYTPLHYLILQQGIPLLVMTSANIKDEPILKEKDEIVQLLGDTVDLILDHNRKIENRIDDSVVFEVSKKVIIMRRARGYAPSPVRSPLKLPPSLATGAEKKNTFAIAKDKNIFLSPHIGEFTSINTLTFFEQTLEKYIKWFGIEPEIIICDMHPDYLSTRWAEKQNKLLIKVQHHFAHILSTIVSENISPPVIGIAMDGTGYGEDGKIWGGELMLVNFTEYTRLGHLEYLPLPGGEKAIRNPELIAQAYLLHTIGKKESEEFFEKDLTNIEKILRNPKLSPPTSSAGRLFDAIAGLLGTTLKASYEGEAPISVENIAVHVEEFYPVNIQNRVFHVKHLLKEILCDIKKNTPKHIIAGKFHRTIAKLIKEWVVDVSRETGIKKVCLGGGVFQNRLLLKMVFEELSGFEVFVPTKVPVNDGGISSGQILLASRYA